MTTVNVNPPRLRKARVRAEQQTGNMPDPAREDWIDFLRWAEAHLQQRFPQRSVVDVVEKPYRFQLEYSWYLRDGGLER